MCAALDEGINFRIARDPKKDGMVWEIAHHIPHTHTSNYEYASDYLKHQSAGGRYAPM